MNRISSTTRNLIADGWGVEDIAIMLDCDVDRVRREVELLRLDGSLKQFFGS